VVSYILYFLRHALFREDGCVLIATDKSGNSASFCASALA
jgi:hypothetical protein